MRYFHRRARGVEGYEPPPGSKEGAQADDLLRTYDEQAARFIVNYGVQQAERTNFSMRFFGALMQCVPGAIAAFETRKAETWKAKIRERAEVDRKREYEQWNERGRAALAALPKEPREALYAGVRADFLARWPRNADQGASPFLNRMIESAVIAKIMGDGQNASSASTDPVRFS